MGGSCEAADSQSDIKQICRKTPDFIKVIPATPEPKITESGPEPEFRPEFRRNFEPSSLLMLSRSGSDSIAVEVSDGDGCVDACNDCDCANTLYLFVISASNAVFKFRDSLF